MGTTGGNKIGKYFAYTLLVIYPLVFLPDYDLTIYMKQAVLYVALAIALLSGIVIAVRERKFFRTRMSMTDFFVLAWLLLCDVQTLCASSKPCEGNCCQWNIDQFICSYTGYGLYNHCSKNKEWGVQRSKEKGYI